MNPLFHLVLTVLVGLPTKLILGVDDLSLLWMLVLTVLIDAMDHGLVISFRRVPLAERARALISARRFWSALRFYYRNRFDLSLLGYMHLHNAFAGLGFFAAASCVYGLSYRSASLVVLVGVAFHLLCDFVDEYRNQGWTKTVRFWLLNPLYALRSIE